MSLAGTCDPSLKFTVMREAPSTTWLLVTMIPSLDQTKPDPSDCAV